MALIQAGILEVAEAYAQAWSSGSPMAVAAFYAPDGQIRINGGDTLKGRPAIAGMAAGFYADFPGLVVRCDDLRKAGDHAIFVWTLEGRHAETKNFVRIGGWEEWELDGNLQIRSSLGWFDAEEYARQIAEGV